MTDPIADLFTKIRNALAASRKEVILMSSRMKLAVVEILKKEGYITDYVTENDSAFEKLRIILKYSEGNKPAMKEVARVSKPGRRIYQSYKDLKAVKGGLGIAIVSTPQGLMTSREARKKRLGGEVICEIF
ncbi:MAG: small subunit ribosomal protein S8 [Parcubacteria group bacterium LiPW_72]|nr:MAG: small subunit ribosomal protein S8 [Parcubacteria group bacterium LiPW_72]